MSLRPHSNLDMYCVKYPCTDKKKKKSAQEIAKIFHYLGCDILKNCVFYSRGKFIPGSFCQPGNFVLSTVLPFFYIHGIHVIAKASLTQAKFILKHFFSMKSESFCCKRVI